MSGQPNPLRRKEWQDEARREQQADERVHKLETALRAIAQMSDPKLTWAEDSDPVGVIHDIHSQATDALDGGGGENA